MFRPKASGSYQRDVMGGWSHIQIKDLSCLTIQSILAVFL